MRQNVRERTEQINLGQFAMFSGQNYSPRNFLLMKREKSREIGSAAEIWKIKKNKTELNSNAHFPLKPRLSPASLFIQLFCTLTSYGGIILFCFFFRNSFAFLSFLRFSSVFSLLSAMKWREEKKCCVCTQNNGNIIFTTDRCI